MESAYERPPTKKMKRYSAAFKYQAVKDSREFGFGGLTEITKRLGISQPTLSSWRRNEAELRAIVGETAESPVLLPKNTRGLVRKDAEAKLVAWYAQTPGPLRRKVVIEKLREFQPGVFEAAAHSNDEKVRRRAGDWLYSFLRRNGLRCKAKEKKVVETQPTAVRTYQGSSV